MSNSQKEWDEMTEALKQDEAKLVALGFIEEPVVAEDEWELGPACGLDPEVCESCQ